MAHRLLNGYRRTVRFLLDHKLVPRAQHLRRINRAIISAMTPSSTMVDGHRMYLDPVDSLRLAQNGIYEPYQSRISLDLIASGDTVVDIGANIGYYTLLFARKVGSQGKVYAFEADPGNFRILEKNVKANGYKNVECSTAAVSSSPGTLLLQKSLNSDGHHHLVNGHSDGNVIEVPAINLDSYFSTEEQKKITFIKMDIEGAELEALRGMRATLSANPDITLVMEFNPSALQRFGTPPNEVLEFVQELGFQFSNIMEKERRIVRCDMDSITNRYTPENGRYTNLICRRHIPA